MGAVLKIDFLENLEQRLLRKLHFEKGIKVLIKAHRDYRKVEIDYMHEIQEKTKRKKEIIQKKYGQLFWRQGEFRVSKNDGLS